MMDRRTKTDKILSFLSRSLLFVVVYQIIAIYIYKWKERGTLSTQNLFKIEFVMYMILSIWFLSFVSLLDMNNLDENSER